MSANKKCFLDQCSRCGKTFGEDQKSRKEHVCRTCIRKEDTKYINRTRSKRNKSPHDMEQLEKLAMFYKD